MNSCLVTKAQTPTVALLAVMVGMGQWYVPFLILLWGTTCAAEEKKSPYQNRNQRNVELHSKKLNLHDQML